MRQPFKLGAKHIQRLAGAILISVSFPALAVSGLLNPFGLKLGDSKQTLDSLQVTEEWSAPESYDEEGDPAFTVHINHKSDGRFYTLTYWKGSLASIELFALYDDDNEKAEQVYRGLFPDFVKALKDYGITDQVDYSEKCSFQRGQVKVSAKLVRHSGGPYGLAQFGFSAQNLDAAEKLERHRESLRRQYEQERVHTGYFFSALNCSRDLKGKEKEHYLEIGVVTEIGPDADQCRQVTEAKKAGLESNGWSCRESGPDEQCIDDAALVDGFKGQMEEGRQGGYTYLRFKDLDGRSTIILFMHAGSMLPICKMFNDGIKGSGTTGKCVDIAPGWKSD